MSLKGYFNMGFGDLDIETREINHYWLKVNSFSWQTESLRGCNTLKGCHKFHELAGINLCKFVKFVVTFLEPEREMH
jgi:hypothetical protein